MFYVKDGKLTYLYNFCGLRHFVITATQRSPPERIKCGWSSPTTAAVSRKAATVTLFIDGKAVGSGRVEQTLPMVFSATKRPTSA